MHELEKAERRHRSVEEVRKDLERTRADVSASVELLRHEVAQTTDWREWVRKRPWTCVGAALVVGIYLGHR